MKSPRRIFRSSPVRPSRIGRTMLGWTLGAVVLVGVTMVGRSTALFGSAPTGPERIQAEANQVAVVAGDTLRLGGRVVRLAGIVSPERGEMCGGADCGGAATTMLAGLVRDRRIECQLSGHDRLGRAFGACEANGVDLSSAVVAGGWARTRPDSPALLPLEAAARRQGAGLWAAAERR